MLPFLFNLPACTASSAAAPLRAVEPPVLPEYLAKAKIIRLLLDYVEWPEGESSHPLVIGVLDPSPFGDYLPQVIGNAVIRGRPLQLRFLRGPSQIPGCDVVFIPEGTEGNLGALLKGLQGKPVLTIGDSPGFARKGVIVNLVLQDNRVRLEVNLSAMKSSGVSISPQVLKGATIVD